MADAPAEGLTFVLPVCNQAPALEAALNAWSSTLRTLDRPFEMLIVDDGSNDGTVEILERLAATNSQLRILRLEQRSGVGAALRLAIGEAQQPLIFYTGLDFDYTPSDLKALLKRIEETDPELNRQPDLVNGFRARTPVPAVWQIVGKLWRGFLRVVIGYPTQPLHGWLGWKAHRHRFWMRVLFGVRLYDIDSKFKLLRRRIFERFPLQSNGDFVHAEIIAKANFLGCLMDELPVAAQPGPFPAAPERLPIRPATRGEMNRVFRCPEFFAPPKPTPPTETPIPDTAPLPIESPPAANA